MDLYLAKEGIKMNKLSAYGAYQSNPADGFVKNTKETGRSNAAKTNRSEKAAKSTAAENTTQTELNLSDKAKELLQQLKEKYSNMDFMVAEYSSEEEAQSYLSRGTKQYSVLIDPETLEAMASDEKTKEKYINLIEESTGKLDDIKDELEEEAKESGSEVKSIGMTIGSDGSVSYFAELEKAGAKQKERIEQSKEKRAEEKKESEKKAEKEKMEERIKGGYGDNISRPTTTVRANSIEELLEKIRKVDWSEVKPERTETGSRFNCTI